MPEHEVRDPQGLRQFTGILHGAVVLLVRLPDIPLRIEAECLVEQPVAAADILLTDRIVRFIPGAGELSSII